MVREQVCFFPTCYSRERGNLVVFKVATGFVIAITHSFTPDS